ncbi:MAG: SsrA-binding protein SmpB [Actinomycetota bacterium]|nr:SsrA-binding protein SmpB [Actinomycetota bacterium]
MARSTQGPPTKLIAQNRRARHDYTIEDTLEAGLVLVGTEVKSCRDGKVNLADAYATVNGDEVWLMQCHISPYSHGNKQNHEPMRPRKLLLHRGEIERLKVASAQQGRTLVPLRMYFKHGIAKAEIAIARGKKTYDRRADIATRDAERRMRQEIGRRR